MVYFDKIIKICLWAFIICLSLNSYSQTYVSVKVSGFNQDIIAEGAGGTDRARATTNTTFDDVTQTGDNVMYSKDFRGNNNLSSPPPFGLPDDGKINSLNLIGAVYQLAPYNQNNALVIKNQNGSGTLVLETPGAFTKIAFLGASANGDSQFDLVLNFSDGTNTTAQFTVRDWFFGTPFAINNIGRVQRTDTLGHTADNFTHSGDNPRLYDDQLTLNPPFNSKLLTSITITKTSSGGRTAIFAINGITAINAPDAPVATVATNVIFNSFTANWQSSNGATGYTIDVSTSPTFSTLLTAYNNLNVGNTTSAQVTGITGNIPYYYRVRAINSSGTSPSSNTITVNYEPCPQDAQYTLTTQAQVNQFAQNFPDCTEIPGNLFIGVSSGTTDITDLTPLSKITHIGGWIAIYNNSLTTLNGLHNLIAIGKDIDIRNNAVLTDISALKNTSFSPADGLGLTIFNNTSLSVCDLPNFCTYLTNTAATHPRTISGNAGDCITEQAVKDACDGTTLLEGEYCTNPISINSLFGKAENVPQNSVKFSTEGYNAENDPTFGHDCIWIGLHRTMWFTFVGDGNKYSIQSNLCGKSSNPDAALYSGDCSGLTAVDCHADINGGDDPDWRFRLEVQTLPGVTYSLMVEASDDEGNGGEFCIEVTRLEKDCIVTIPDANFKNYLLANTDINTNEDNEIQCAEAEDYSGNIICPNLNIQDLTGIEAFKNLSGLNCSNNEITSLRLVDNIHMLRLNCSDNKISSLTLPNNPDMWELICSNNRIAAIDVSKILWLEEFMIDRNNLSVLDISGNRKVSSLSCNDNHLNSLNLANTNNSFLKIIHAQNNPNLTCIQVDDETYSNENWKGSDFTFDDHASFSNYCAPCTSGNIAASNFLVSANACVGDSFHIIDYSIIDTVDQNTHFTWDFGNGNTSTDRDPVVTYNTPGQYTILLSLESEDCSFSVSKTIDVLGCLVQHEKNNQYAKLYPNPTSEQAMLNINLPKESPVSIRIFTLAGNLVYSEYIEEGDHILKILPELNKGIYITEIRYDFGSEKHKLLVL
jgi:hypothetical protein